MGEKKLHKNKSKPLQIPYFKSIARESKIHLLCPLTTVQNVKFLMQVNTQQNTGKPEKKKRKSFCTAGLHEVSGSCIHWLALEDHFLKVVELTIQLVV